MYGLEINNDIGWKDKIFRMSFMYIFLIIVLALIGTMTLYSAANGNWEP